MRIGLVSNFRGGLRQFATTLCEGLQKNGFEVDVLCPASLEIAGSRQVVTGPAVYRGVSALARLLTARYDLIHCNIASLGIIPVVRREMSRIPIVETFHGFPQWWLEPRIMDKVAYTTEFGAVRIMAKLSSSRASVSNFVRSTLQQVLGIESTVVYNGIAHCPDSDLTREESRNLLNIDEDTIVLLFVGRLHPAKDPMTLLRALEILARRGRKVKLLVVGGGPLAQSFHRDVRSLCLERQVYSWKYLPSLHPVYAAADVFCFPSVNEAFGIVLLEAMDHSLPLIFSDSGATHEVAGSAGVSFRTGDEVDLANKLTLLIDDPKLREKLGREGRRRIDDYFRLDSMVKSYVQIYEETLSSRGGRA
ncbi:MAG TPA: glycosyltransferase family 4 protein [Candidatus Bathyarchaeia archaeon]|nr:glycosyltransferase family 4 protein [Candidatus Bathyarchaeia archaeon]